MANSPLAEPLASGFDCASAVTHALPALVRHGYKWAGRYYSHNLEKNLTEGEAQACTRAGVSLVSVWESAGDHIGAFNRRQGIADANAALALARALRQTPQSGIYFAVDFNPAPGQLGQIGEYFRGINDVLAAPDYRTGVYGSGLVCRTMLAENLASLSWLAGATSWRGIQSVDWHESQAFGAEGAWHIRQHVSVRVPGVPFQIDPDATQDGLDWGAWVAPLAHD